ncbi:MAG: delta-class carbonic anhydrase [Mariprofundaceae bacterium]|nr:delta-class carbonic anhydrase [Mariprofundaceae bacterium]
MEKTLLTLATGALLAAPWAVSAHEHEGHGAKHQVVSDSVIEKERQILAESTKGKGFGPQAPRDIDVLEGRNLRVFSAAPASKLMNLCNIHFHKNAEHKAHDFSVYAGNGNGFGYLSGYKYSGHLSKQELKPMKEEVCNSHHGDGALLSGDTIEVHYVYTTAQVKPGQSLGACFNKDIPNQNPQLRVETQVYVVVNDKHALDFKDLTQVGKNKAGFYQAVGIPNNTGDPVQYEGSTTGPGYNEKGSPYQVTWSVRPHVAKVNIATVGKWCEGNIFKENHGHGVRNLVKNPDLLSQIN